MKNFYCSCLWMAFSIAISPSVQAQHRSDLSCDDVGKLILYAQTEFSEILGKFDSTVVDCNYYYSKVNFGIDSTTTIQSCKGDKGKYTLHFDVYIGNDEIQSEIELNNLEAGLDNCLPKVKIKELKPTSGYKRIVQYTYNKMQMTIYLDEVKNKREMKPLVTISVNSLL